MAGCASIMEAFAREIGADGYAPDGGTAVEKAKMLLGRKLPMQGLFVNGSPLAVLRCP